MILWVESPPPLGSTIQMVVGVDGIIYFGSAPPKSNFGAIFSQNMVFECLERDVFLRYICMENTRSKIGRSLLKRNIHNFFLVWLLPMEQPRYRSQRPKRHV